MKHKFILPLLCFTLLIPACSTQPPPGKTDYKKIVGRWVRPDGGYVLDIKDVHADGRMDAAYLNPRPINVSDARANISENTINIRVELRDRFYPGSYYTLTYDPRADRLDGVYHHLGINQNFNVFFVRE